MPISYKRQPSTLQEKVDKAIQLSYQIHDTGDSEFLRAFLIYLLDKALTKIYPSADELGPSFGAFDQSKERIELQEKLDELKRLQE